MNKESTGEDAVMAGVTDAEKILELVPEQYRGLLFEKVFKGYNSSEGTRRLELAFAAEFAERCKTNGLMYSLLLAKEDDPRRNAAPWTPRDWQVAHLAIATFVQYLGTSGGCSLFYDAFRRAGGKLRYELPSV